jgi:hypothetical protein
LLLWPSVEFKFEKQKNTKHKKPECRANENSSSVKSFKLKIQEGFILCMKEVIIVRNYFRWIYPIRKLDCGGINPS